MSRRESEKLVNGPYLCGKGDGLMIYTFMPGRISGLSEP
jgi:hypothetical protein